MRWEGSPWSLGMRRGGSNPRVRGAFRAGYEGVTLGRPLRLVSGDCA